MIQVYIQNDGTTYEPVVVDKATISWERKGTAGKCELTVMDDAVLQMTHGNPLMIRKDDKNIFYGFLFSFKRDKDDQIKVTAYDQLRYLKNKDTYLFEDKTATEIIQMIAGDFNLQTGSLADTGFKMTRVEDNQTLFDMIINALDLTLIHTGQMYVFYDDGGSLTLTNIEDMHTDILIDATTGEDYDYQTSIDGETSNKVKLIKENKETGEREIYIAQSSENMNKWGVLQHFDTIDEDTDGETRANQLLELYNQPEHSFKIKGAFGSTDVRAGTLIPVQLDLGLQAVQNYLMVESVKHIFEAGAHSMDLTLRGGGFG